MSSTNECMNIPLGYTLENKLISVIVNEFLFNKINSKEFVDVQCWQKELSEMLLLKLKLPIFRVELTKEDQLVTGLVESIKNNPLKFEIKI